MKNLGQCIKDNLLACGITIEGQKKWKTLIENASREFLLLTTSRSNAAFPSATQIFFQLSSFGGKSLLARISPFHLHTLQEQYRSCFLVPQRQFAFITDIH